MLEGTSRRRHEFDGQGEFTQQLKMIEVGLTVFVFVHE